MRVQSSRTQEKRKRLETEALLRNISNSTHRVEKAVTTKAEADPLFEAASDSEDDAESGSPLRKEPQHEQQKIKKKKHDRDAEMVELPQKRRRKKKKERN